MSKTQLHIAFIGFGELGQRFARDLAHQHGISLSAYDRLATDTALGAPIRETAQRLRVHLAKSGADAAQSADIVISAVTADQTGAVAAEAARYLGVGQVFFDLNSASPQTKSRAAEAFAGGGAHYVEGAVMGAVKAPGIRVEILAGGPRAADVVEVLNPVGMNITAVSKTPGKASAIKLCRSIMIKGMEAIIVDCAAATRHFGVEKEVYGSLAATFPSIDWPALADDMAERIATHGIRRAAEMREAASMVAEIGRVPDLTAAIAEAHQRGAKPKGQS